MNRLAAKRKARVDKLVREVAIHNQGSVGWALEKLMTLGEQEAAEGLVGLKDLRAGTEQADQRLTPEALLEAMTRQDLSTDGCQARV